MSYIRKIILPILFFCFAGTVSAQLDGNLYEGFKVDKKKSDIEIIDIHVLPIGGGVKVFSDGQNKPLEGKYHIVIHRRRYILCDFKKGIPHGDFEEYQQLYLYQKGTYKDGKLDGDLYKYTYGDLVRHSVFNNGIIREETSHFSNGQVRCKRTYDENGNLHGHFLTYDKHKNVNKEERYQYGKLHGEQMEISNMGAKRITTFDNGVRSGLHEEYFPNGSISCKGQYDNGERNGAWIWKWENGEMKEEGNFCKGKRHGEQKEYYENGLLSKYNEYADGKRNGKSAYYTKDPYYISYESNYVNDKYHGEYKKYNRKGELYQISIYKDEKAICEKEYRNGKVTKVSLIDERGTMVKVEEYNSEGKRTYKNTGYKKPNTIKLKETSSGVIDIEF